MGPKRKILGPNRITQIDWLFITSNTEIDNHNTMEEKEISLIFLPISHDLDLFSYFLNTIMKNHNNFFFLP